MKLADLQALISGACVDDIIVPGFVDLDEQPVRFYPLHRAVFIECGGISLQLAAIGETGRMLVSKAESLTCYADLRDEFLPAFASVKKTVMNDPDGTNRIVAMHFRAGVEVSEGIECAAAQLDLANGQKVFADPLYYFGIRLRGAEQYAIWLENSVEKDHRHTQIDLT